MNSPPNAPTAPLPSPKRADGRSLADFKRLLPAEQTLLDKCAKGEEAKMGDAVPADDSDPNKIVRAGFLRFLLLGGDDNNPVHEQGVRLYGAWIKGELDLQSCRVPHGTELCECKFDQQIVARDAHIAGAFVLSGSHLQQGLRADRLRCDASVFLQNNFQSFATVRLLGAQIGSQLNCFGGQFEPKEGDAIFADGVVVKGNVVLSNQFKAKGAVRLLSAQIGGQLNCSGGQFEPKEGDAIFADGVVVKGDVILSNQFKAKGTVRLLGAQIGGQLNCSGGQFEPKEGDAIFADGVVVKGDVILSNQFKATGTVRLLGAQIGGDLDCSDGQFEPKEGDAISADGVVVKGKVVLSNQFKAKGTVRLLGAQIGGQLNCSDGQFEPKEGDAIFADGVVVKGDVILSNQFKAKGAVWLLGAQIGSSLDCSGGQFSAGINLPIAAIKSRLILRDMATPACINATFAQIGELVDDPKMWAKGSILDGLVYRSISGTGPIDATQRIDWLKQQSDEHLGEGDLKQRFRPQPWKQLQKVLREMGHDADARRVGVAFEDQLRKADRIGQITDTSKAQKIIPVVSRQCLRGLHWLFGKLAGYGYHPTRLFMSMVAVWLLCAVAYWCLALPPHNALGPTDPLVFQNPAYAACTSACMGNWFLCPPLPAEYTTFSPLAYSLDLLLPLVDLGQEKNWGPLVPTPERHFYVELFSFSLAHWVRLLNWFEVLYGWVASLLFVAIVSGMSRRSETEK